MSNFSSDTKVSCVPVRIQHLVTQILEGPLLRRMENERENPRNFQLFLTKSRLFRRKSRETSKTILLKEILAPECRVFFPWKKKTLAWFGPQKKPVEERHSFSEFLSRTQCFQQWKIYYGSVSPTPQHAPFSCIVREPKKLSHLNKLSLASAVQILV